MAQYQVKETVWGLQLGLIDAGSSTHSLSVQLSAVETSFRTQMVLASSLGHSHIFAAVEIKSGSGLGTRLEHPRNSSGSVSRNYAFVCHDCILAAATIRGGGYFAQSSRLCDYYSRAVSNQRNSVYHLILQGYDPRVK